MSRHVKQKYTHAQTHATRGGHGRPIKMSMVLKPSSPESWRHHRHHGLRIEAGTSLSLWFCQPSVAIETLPAEKILSLSLVVVIPTENE